jgi:hypothetical protein
MLATRLSLLCRGIWNVVSLERGQTILERQEVAGGVELDLNWPTYSDLQLIMSLDYFPTKNTTIAPFPTQNNSTTTPGVPLSKEVRYFNIKESLFQTLTN